MPSAGFHRYDSELRCEGCPLESLAQSYGTPLYVYSRGSLIENFSQYRDAFSAADPLICFSVKSNGNLAVLRTLAALGAGADIVSGGELFRAIRAGIEPGKIVYSGVGKRGDEIARAIEAGIYMFNVESESELYLISVTATSMGAEANISLRMNPDIDAGTHHFTATARRETKFGIPEEEAPRLYRKAAALPGVNPVGVDVHLGSQITDIGPYRQALERLSMMVETVRAAGIDCRVMDIGGGFGITYRDERPVTPAEIAALAIPVAERTGCALVLEPGRSIAGSAGALLTRIVHVKESGGRVFYICDAGMNDLIRPPLYGA
ncbi:MAG: diaminopimelate decarboxylase, partial [Spirochaetes bacterium]|nr:diaminopimelate decarboxylase [Spirochaetota bacterium]